MTIVEEITTCLTNLPEEGQRDVLDFVKSWGHPKTTTSLRERGRELAQQARARSVGVPEVVLDREIEDAITEVRQRGRA